MLQSLLDELAPAGALVSFNGKSFDAPLLEMRFSFHRLRGRSAIRRTWTSFTRPAVSGRAARPAASSPARSRAQQRLLGIRRTTASQASRFLAGHFSSSAPATRVRWRLFSSTSAATCCRWPASPRGCWLSWPTDRLRPPTRARRWHSGACRRRQAGRSAADALQRALALNDSLSDVRIEALRALAEVRRRNREHQGAAECWQQLLDSSECPRHVAHEAARRWPSTTNIGYATCVLPRDCAAKPGRCGAARPRRRAQVSTGEDREENDRAGKRARCSPSFSCRAERRDRTPYAETCSFLAFAAVFPALRGLRAELLREPLDPAFRIHQLLLAR